MRVPLSAGKRLKIIAKGFNPGGDVEKRCALPARRRSGNVGRRRESGARSFGLREEGGKDVSPRVRARRPFPSLTPFVICHLFRRLPDHLPAPAPPGSS